mmetsp:Transcript_22516/g.62517  ORF Transcript_22516/g.62517 Transcript_22516/m.62517 type:complete len:1123 (-) Transcript_22516:1874-5242(-)
MTELSQSSSKSAVYPYSRSEECTWQPEEVARHIAALLSMQKQGGDGRSSALLSSSALNSASPQHHQQQPFLLTQGWSDAQVRVVRQLFGRNRMSGEDSEELDNAAVVMTNNGNTLVSCWRQARRNLKQYTKTCVGPIASALGSQLKEPLILMLLGSAGISLILGNTADAMSIALALLIVATVAAVQEYRSEAAIEKLNNLVPHTCTVVRNGVVHDNFLAQDLVVGDLVLLATGDRVPADCRVVDSIELAADESSLTGENHPVAKTGEALNTIGAQSPSISQQDNVCFCGSLIRAGRGRALVVAIGDSTEFGKVATELATVKTRKSPLQSKMDELGSRLALLSSIAIAMIAVLGWILGRPFLETLTVAVSLAVAAIPEGLPICVTVTLALGVLRMARRNAIVKKLPVVESLGCVTAVASDKTGTLTQNEMTVRTVFCLAMPSHTFGFTGVGYDPSNGSLVHMEEDGPALKQPGSPRKVAPDSSEMQALSALFYTASLCNNATLTQSQETGKGKQSLFGQPTELALLCATSKAGLVDPRPQYHRLQEIPFTSERKCMDVRARPIGGHHACSAFTKALLDTTTQPATPTSAARRPSFDGSLYFVKGMPEKILGECKTYTSADGSLKTLVEDDRTLTLAQSRRMAATGLRVLALAYGKSLGDLTFAGIVGMEDPPRAGVSDSVRHLREGGVKVMMVTGDSKETALAIAQRCGITGPVHSTGGGHVSRSQSSSSLIDLQLPNDSSHSDVLDTEAGAGAVSEALSGEELDNIPTQNMAESIAGVKVFYRVVPRHKLAIVRALQELGEIVVMTGDGVNDATALKGADIGVAMGKKGTDVAKEASDIVLADDDFQTITMSIAEGKGIFFNIRCFLSFQLSTSFAALTMASVATAFGLPSPLNAMQILWINIIMDGPPAQSLGVEPVDERILRAKPRKADDPIVTRALLLRAITSAILIVIGTLYVFKTELEDDGKVSRRDTTMTFMTFVNFDLFNAYACRSADRCFFELSLMGNPAFLWAVGGSIVGQLLLIFWPPLQEIFQTEALSLYDLGYIIFLSSSILWLDTARKLLCRRWFSDGYNPSPRTLSPRRSRGRLPKFSWLGLGRLDGKARQASIWKSNKEKSKTLLAL